MRADGGVFDLLFLCKDRKLLCSCILQITWELIVFNSSVVEFSKNKKHLKEVYKMAAANTVSAVRKSVSFAGLIIASKW